MTDPLRIQLPDAERGLSDREIARFDKAVRRAKAEHLKPRQREAAMEEAHAIEHGPREAKERLEVERGIAETVELAEARGEEVKAEKTHRRIVDRDPLKALEHRLTAEQYRVGKRLQKCYEMRGRDAGAMDYADTRGGFHDNNRYVASRIERAQQTEFLGRVERSVALVSPQALNMLRAVIGQWIAISAFGGRGREIDRSLEFLRQALDVALKEEKR